MIPKVMLIAMEERHSNATKVQKLLTKYGCYIKVRVGMHETEKVCSPCGLIVLQMTDNPKEIRELKEALNKVDGVNAKFIQMKC
jgi:hypothetical protein